MLGSSKRPCGKRFEGGRVRKLSANNSLTRQRAVLCFSSDPCAVNEKVKLCQLVVKSRRHWVRDLEISLRQTSLIGKRDVCVMPSLIVFRFSKILGRDSDWSPHSGHGANRFWLAAIKIWSHNVCGDFFNLNFKNNKGNWRRLQEG